MLCLKCGHDENTRTHKHAHAMYSPCWETWALLAACPPGETRWSPVVTVDDVTVRFKATSVNADTPLHAAGTCAYTKTHTGEHVHAGSDQFSLATSVLSSNVLIMIGFVCNYKHSETPISKNFIEFRPMGILGCFSKMRAAPHIHHHYRPPPPSRPHTNEHTHSHTSLQKETLLFEPCVRLLHTPWRPFAQSPKVNTSCLCVSSRTVPWAQLLQRPGPTLFFFNSANAPSFKVKPQHLRETRLWGLSGN